MIRASGAMTLALPDLTDVVGELRVSGGNAPSVKMPALERVHGRLELRLRDQARAMFPRLTHVGGPLGLDVPPHAVRLPRLRRLGKGLWLFGYGPLSEVLPNLRAIAGTLYLSPSGTMHGVLPQLAWVGGHVVLHNRAHFDFRGLERLEAVGGGVYLFGGNTFSLPRLKEVRGALAIQDSRAERLDRVGRKGARVGALLLRDNAALRRWPHHLSVPEHRVSVRGSPLLSEPSGARASLASDSRAR